MVSSVRAFVASIRFYGIHEVESRVSICLANFFENGCGIATSRMTKIISISA